MRIAFFLALGSDAIAWGCFLLAWRVHEDALALAGGLVLAFFVAAGGALVSILGLIAAALGTRNREERLGYSLFALAISLGSIVLFAVVIDVAVTSSAAPIAG